MSRRSVGFGPIADSGASILILGSMPSAASLTAEQYYAHPRNAFWPIVGALLGVPPAADYPQRAQALMAAGIALWDVVHSCRRPGSLDASIDTASIRANDFGAFYAAHPRIELICCNGTAAARLYRTHVERRLMGPTIPLLRLPSTSPAHAARNFDAKLQAWRAALARALPVHPSVRP